MKKMMFLVFGLFLMFSLISCAAAPDAAPGGSYGDGFKGESSMDAIETDGTFDSEEVEGEIPDAPEEDDGTNTVVIPAGQITACAYNDNDHYTFWQGLLTTTQEGYGLFNEYYNKFAFKTTNRLKLSFPAKTYVEVSLMNGDKVLSKSIADANGICYLYPQNKSDSYDVILRYLGPNGDYVEEKQTITGDTNFVIDAMEAPKNRIELMFVIDTTGSMGDEINYVKAEVADVISRVSSSNPNTEVLLSVLVYRDHKDEYVTKYSDFNTDIAVSQAFINNEYANGGGDFEEAVDDALALAATKQWSNTATKILVHIADAPAHDEDVVDWNNTVLELASKGIRIITVASSGIDKKTEYFFRSQSLMTNGHYVYITNDSGIGNEHLEATVEKKPVVEFLNDSLVRLINGYHTGVIDDPTYYGNVNKNQ